MIGAESVLGLSEGAFVMVLASVLGLAGVVGAAWLQSRRTQATVEKTKETLGEPDDDLTVVEMLREILAGQTGQDIRLAKHDAKLAVHDRRLDEHHRKLTHHEELLRQLRGEEN